MLVHTHKYATCFPLVVARFLLVVVCFRYYLFGVAKILCSNQNVAVCAWTLYTTTCMHTCTHAYIHMYI